MDVTITEQDFLNAGSYTDPAKCPGARMAQRVLSDPTLLYSHGNIYTFVNKERKIVAELRPSFAYAEYVRLSLGEEHHATLKIL